MVSVLGVFTENVFTCFQGCFHPCFHLLAPENIFTENVFTLLLLCGCFCIIMVQNQITTRVSPENYSKMLRRCADGNCTPYQYLQNLVVEDLNNYAEFLDREGPEGEGPEKHGITITR